MSTEATKARAGASASVAVSTAALLSRLLACPSAAAATKLLSSSAATRSQRRKLAELAGIEAQWVGCDQAIASNVADLAHSVVVELYEPFWFFRGSLRLGASDGDKGAATGGGSRDRRKRARPRRPGPRQLFAMQKATSALKRRGSGFWTASGAPTKHAFLPGLDIAGPATFDAVVHFVQAGSGTGVHVGQGLILTCAHVVDSRDDEATSGIPRRVGRQKVVMFSSGRTFLAECAAAVETADGVEVRWFGIRSCTSAPSLTLTSDGRGKSGPQDVAVLSLGAEVAVAGLPTQLEDTEGSAGPSAAGSALAAPEHLEPGALPAAEVADQAVELGGRLFCVGNPSNVDLESLGGGEIEFDPPTWHTSVGQCEGYVSEDTQAKIDAQSQRGRPPTRGELKAVSDATPACSMQGGYLQHSCWTYWGHSGAPLFNETGRVVGLHCAWDDRTGMRHGQKVQNLHTVLAAAGVHRMLAHPLRDGPRGTTGSGDDCIACLISDDDESGDESPLPLMQRLAQRKRQQACTVSDDKRAKREKR